MISACLVLLRRPLGCDGLDGHPISQIRKRFDKGAKEPNNPSTVSLLVPAGDKLTTASGEDSQKDFEVV